MELFDSRQLRTFQALARERSFTGAAESLRLTQSAVSHSIRTLEEHTGCRLVERDRRSVRLTPRGQAFLRHVDQIIGQMRQAQDALIAPIANDQASLRIGTTDTFGQFILPRMLRELSLHHPDLSVRVVTGRTRDQQEQLALGLLDVVFALMTPEEEGRFEFRRLFDDHLGFALAPSHPLASQGIDLLDLERELLIIHRRDSDSFRLVDGYYEKLGLDMREPYEVGSIAAVKETAKTGLGLGVIPRWVALKDLAAGTLKFRPMPARALSRRWGLYFDPHADLPIPVDRLDELCRSAIDSILVDSPTAHPFVSAVTSRQHLS